MNSALISADLSQCTKLLVLSDGCFSGCTRLNNVKLPPKLTKISYGCFYYDYALTKIEFPDTLTEIAGSHQKYGRVFGFSGIKEVTIGQDSQLQYIGVDVFANTNLEYFHIPSKCVLQDGSCFQSCPIIGISVDERNTNYKVDGQMLLSGSGFSNLVYVSSRLTGTFQVPSYITSIGNSAFRGSKFNKIILSSNVTFIDAFCLGECQIVDFEFPIQIKTIPSFMFQACPNLVTVTLTENITEIKDYAFYCCIKLKNIVLPSSLKQLRRNAFIGCISLSEITLPKNLETIEDGVFTEIPNLTLHSLSPKYVVDNNIMYKDDNRTLLVYVGSEQSTYISILSECNFIGAGIFAKKKIRDVTFKSSNVDLDITIGENAFKESTIHSIVFPPGLKTISNLAFDGCSQLESVTFQGTKITTISRSCFMNCNMLSSFTIPTSITSIEEYAFANCRNLGDIGLANLNFLTYIGTYAFSESGLTTANLPSSIESVGIRAFSNSQIIDLTISCNIPSMLCQSCTSLITLTLNNGVTDIGTYAFDGCTSLTDFIIPSSLASIQGFAFQSCEKLKTLIMGADCTLSKVDGGCFYGCFSLKSVKLPQNDQRYRFENGALTNHEQTKLILFLPYSGVKNFIVPLEMVTIGSCAFMGSPTLLRVFFNGNNINTIDYQAFKDCRNLNFVFFSSSSISQIGTKAFDGCPLLHRCGSFSAPQDVQDKLVNIANIPKIAFSEDCALANSCRAIKNIGIPFSYLYPFLTIEL
ncbi:surface antigen BspA-like [Trichomonas vaginalis G3]|uniref:Surface antigen BspA-like n=1 Tax=Trichomonas vaginalis (strain ATCC PRA-98 / G3) TaxID=412133 RepID=A2FJW2_TRIV3|nr:surface antigen BspA-like [Trichomonas vaginalis G3]|eukprot:XP_001307744.1 surface antigen BspA-like [Trichomonas vaginalis G3]